MTNLWRQHRARGPIGALWVRRDRDDRDLVRMLDGGSSVAYQLEARFAGSDERLPKENHFSPVATARAATQRNMVAFRLVAMNDYRSIFVFGTADDAAKFKSSNGLITTDPSWTVAFDRILPKSAAEE